MACLELLRRQHVDGSAASQQKFDMLRDEKLRQKGLLEQLTASLHKLSDDKAAMHHQAKRAQAAMHEAQDEVAQAKIQVATMVSSLEQDRRDQLAEL